MSFSPVLPDITFYVKFTHEVCIITWKIFFVDSRPKNRLIFLTWPNNGKLLGAVPPPPLWPNVWKQEGNMSDEVRWGGCRVGCCCLRWWVWGGTGGCWRGLRVSWWRYEVREGWKVRLLHERQQCRYLHESTDTNGLFLRNQLTYY